MLVPLIWALATGADAPAEEAPPPYRPRVAAASSEGELAARGIRLAPGLKAELFAAEPMLANPVAFALDHLGRLYVAETFRLHAGVTDNRQHMYWLDDDLAARTVADRVALHKRHDPNAAKVYGTEHDRVRRIVDTDGDGKADLATVFADGFNAIPDGLGSGLLARGSDVYFTCIPHLWLLRDPDLDGVADERRSLHHGFGVHVAFSGHDLHGLCLGPDGRLYFSIGDRGLHVETPDGTLAVPDTGAVLRCELDGSRLEVFATGLRNPQELAFNELGDLFTGDNNSDSGDKARWVHLVEGSDSGWRMAYQYIEAPVSRGPWNAEKLWLPRWEGQAAYILPPVANLGDGPSGLAFYPGTGLPARYDGHFFLADFRGASGMSGLWSFAVEPSGASYSLAGAQQPVWNVLATDCAFGPDGALYVSDWVAGWNVTGKGRIYRVFAPELGEGDEVAEVRRLLAGGVADRDTSELTSLLDHRDQRVRQEAQMALAGRGVAALPALFAVARRGGGRLGKLHAVWALGQIARRDQEVLPPLVALLEHDEPEVRAQAARVCGELRAAGARAGLRVLLGDANSRVRFFAAAALGKVAGPEDVGPLCNLLQANGDADVFIRHAAVMGLAGIKDTRHLLAAARDSSTSVRLGVLLALRRLASPAVAVFLGDPSPALVLEAARAIYDLPLYGAMQHLAAVPLKPETALPLVRRVISAGYRLGTPGDVARLAGFAARDDLGAEARAEALAALADWAQPSPRDRILGDWRPLPPRSPESLAAPAAALAESLLGLLAAGDPALREAAVDAATRLALKPAAPALRALCLDGAAPGKLRSRALEALAALGDADVVNAARRAASDSDPALRVQGQKLLARLNAGEALPLLENALATGSVAEKQGALAALGAMRSAAAEAILARSLEALLAGRVDPAVELDLMEAAESHGGGALRELRARCEASRDGADPLARYRDCVQGGDATRGARVFFQKREVACQRCHRTHRPGGEVGPNLAGIGQREPREHLLESIVDPNRKIARGYDSITVVNRDGQILSGVLRGEDDSTLEIVSTEDTLLSVDKSDVLERSGGVSAMPEDAARFLTRRELRDLVEFLSSLKDQPPLK